jgi:hypothetical protein
MRNRQMLWVALATALVVASGLAAAFAFAGRDGSASPAGASQKRAIKVPKLVGTQNRPAQELLARRGLRWKYFGSDRVWSKPPPRDVFSTADDNFVIKQAPAPGTRVRAGSVIRLRTNCAFPKQLPPGFVCID